jgi:hypothetical protein
MRKKLITTIWMTVALASCAVLAIPVADADTGPPQQGGGCHMVFSPSSTGLTNMMAGSARGEGAANMADMLSRFSPLPFCGA